MSEVLFCWLISSATSKNRNCIKICRMYFHWEIVFDTSPTETEDKVWLFTAKILLKVCKVTTIILWKVNKENKRILLLNCFYVGFLQTKSKICKLIVLVLILGFRNAGNREVYNSIIWILYKCQNIVDYCHNMFFFNQILECRRFFKTCLY